MLNEITVKTLKQFWIDFRWFWKVVTNFASILISTLRLKERGFLMKQDTRIKNSTKIKNLKLCPKMLFLKHQVTQS